MNNSLKIQAQIRQNAEEVSSYLSDLAKWENRVKVKDAQIRSSRPVNPPASTPLTHTPSSSINDNAIRKPLADMTTLTPASIVSSEAIVESSDSIPAPRRSISDKDAEEAERERGNSEFQLGNFQAAVKSYTRCLGLKVANYLAFSNRAMALLKLKEYTRAETDCTCALNIQPDHTKSLVRRATARNALGKHRGALKDLLLAEQIDPSSKAVRADIQKTRELLRAAINRAPLVKLVAQASPPIGPSLPVTVN